MTKFTHVSTGHRGAIVRSLMTLIVAFCSIGLLMAQSDRKVSIDVNDVPIRTALEQLQKEAKTHFVYDEEIIDAQKRVTLSYVQTPLSVVLDDFCRQTSLKYEIKRDLILLFTGKTGTPKSSFTMTGTVRDETGETIIGATVSIAGTQKGVWTNENGQYSLEVSPGDMISFTYVGMADQVIKADRNKKTVDVQMQSSATLLKEVVVTGYQTLSKERATGSYAVISDKHTKGKLETNVLSRIEGLVAGINKSAGKDNDIVIRGITTIHGEQNPLYIVDGMPYQGNLDAINPTDVQNITVLKDASASSIYGARAANGVIVITTKRGQEGKTRVSYNSSAKFIPKPDLSYLNLMNNSELVDMQIEGFNFYHAKFDDLNERYSLNPVIALLYKHEKKELSDDELKKALAVYRGLDNRSQIEKEFARTGFVHQHNLSVSGGTQANRYIATLNYLGDYGNEKFRERSRIGFSLKDDIKFFEWLSADFGVAGSFYRNSGDNGVKSYMDLISGYPGYYMLRDEAGNPIPLRQLKSEYEIERLKSIGLKDQTFSPIRNRSEEFFRDTENYLRIQAGLKVNLAEGLNLDLKYQTENTHIKNRQIYTVNSFKVRNMINDAAQYNPQTKNLTLNVPDGGQLDETRSDFYSYTLRSQLNFNRTYGKHEVAALAGAERRLVRSTGTRNYYMGYDDNSLGIKPINPLILDPLRGTESLSGAFTWVYDTYNYLKHLEDRFVSFYANASYTFDNRYALTGSIRIDQSNLFGTDPKYQYRPLWSLGGSWRIANEEFMKEVSWINRLNMRLTSGVGGNVPKTVGPYLNIINTGYNPLVGEFGSRISYPPNAELRWEKTVSTNIGIDFDLFNSRLGGSIDYYHKNTSDLLGERNADPTLGWPTLMVNYGSMVNKGIELSLQGMPFKTRNFSWNISGMFSYNKNELTNLKGTKESVFDYTARNVQTVGRPINSLFSYRYAGLDPKDGSVLVYNRKGEKVKNVGSVEDLVYSGTRDPKYTASLKNSFGIGDFDFSFMFVYYGGHVIRDVVSDYLTGAPGTNIDRKALNHWRKPGDEKIPGVAPALNTNIYYTEMQTWYSADVHVKKADYIKLRDISLTYNLPKKLLNKLSIGNASLTCQISNIWWWAANGDIDPEAYTTIGYGRGWRTLPNPATYTLGLSLNF
ncbi:SusC/RagA family TonB-linked outer membrane protein [Porphyromonas macacae]|uniref:SusC/RagA family TonB-linked outer membrane protein n=1 Tax=Porphyromonas macacae TaxID=28115 RepID=UPI0035A08E7E